MHGEYFYILSMFVSMVGGGWFCFNEWLLGRTGGERKEFVNYEWRTSLDVNNTQFKFVCVCLWFGIC